jgi:riboflavin kinase / FMN adenylyltransferase
MRVIRNLLELDHPLEASSVTIGNFDGVHLAHQRLFRHVVESARELGAVPTALTFDPHPAQVLAPDRAPSLLTSLERKARLIEQVGIERLVVLAFNRDLARLSPAEFVRIILVEHLRVASVSVGPNFRFGYQQAGDTTLLAELAHRDAFRLEVVPILHLRRERVSSSRVRELLAEGRVEMAGRLLGRPFSVEGPIVAGSGVGRAQTVPTLNLAPIAEQLPKRGVYVTRTRLGDSVHDSVTNVGTKPTFGEHRLTVESYLLSSSGEIRETEMEIAFLYRLRDELKFPSPAALKAQIQKDAARSLRFFRRLERFSAVGCR